MLFGVNGSLTSRSSRWAKRHELSLQAVDARVAALMAEMGQERRAALAAFFQGLRQLGQERRELILGVSILGVLTYAWGNVQPTILSLSPSSL